jgi:hypothetical protein
MEFLYDVSLTFIVFDNLVHKPHAEVIGCYQDSHDALRRVKRESAYGKKILELYGFKEKFVLTENEIKVKELIDMLSGKMDMNKVTG